MRKWSTGDESVEFKKKIGKNYNSYNVMDYDG